VHAHGAEGERGTRELLVARADGEEDVECRNSCSGSGGAAPCSSASGEEDAVQELREGMW
jgi:hypothetical protein